MSRQRIIIIAQALTTESDEIVEVGTNWINALIEPRPRSNGINQVSHYILMSRQTIIIIAQALTTESDEIEEVGTNWKTNGLIEPHPRSKGINQVSPYDTNV